MNRELVFWVCFSLRPIWCQANDLVLQAPLEYSADYISSNATGELKIIGDSDQCSEVLRLGSEFQKYRNEALNSPENICFQGDQFNLVLFQNLLLDFNRYSPRIVLIDESKNFSQIVSSPHDLLTGLAPRERVRALFEKLMNYVQEKIPRDVKKRNEIYEVLEMGLNTRCQNFDADLRSYYEERIPKESIGKKMISTTDMQVFFVLKPSGIAFTTRYQYHYINVDDLKEEEKIFVHRTFDVNFESRSFPVEKVTVTPDPQVVF